MTPSKLCESSKRGRLATAVEALLAQLARHDPDGAVRIAAIRRLTDRLALTEIAGAAVQDDMRSAAAKRLKELAGKP